MMNSKNNRTVFTLFLIAMAGLMVSVGASARPNASGSPSSGLSDEEEYYLVFMREEEKLARDSYLVLLDKWGLPIFGNIAESEQRHMDAVGKLIDKYGLEDPVADESVINHFVDPELQHLFEFLMELGDKSMMDALVVGAMIEETDIIDIQHAIDSATHDDIIYTYESLMCGSRNHLRAFVAQIDINGGRYDGEFLESEDFLAIVNTPVERDCGSLEEIRGERPR